MTPGTRFNIYLHRALVAFKPGTKIKNYLQRARAPIKRLKVNVRWCGAPHWEGPKNIYLHALPIALNPANDGVIWKGGSKVQSVTGVSVDDCLAQVRDRLGELLQAEAVARSHTSPSVTETVMMCAASRRD
jgi:hypothetical protein